MTVTNFDFAAKTGIHYTMASRLRNGERKPGLATVTATKDAFQLSDAEVTEWLDHIAQGAEQSGKWLREHIFDAPSPEALPATG